MNYVWLMEFINQKHKEEFVMIKKLWNKFKS